MYMKKENLEYFYKIQFFGQKQQNMLLNQIF